MCPEYRLVVSFQARNGQEAEKNKAAILQIKGVKAALWSEVPIVPASPKEALEIFLDELDSLQYPSIITGSIIRSRLPDLDKYFLRDLVKDGLVTPSIEYPGRGPREFTIEEAKRIGTFWYLRTQGIHPKMAASHPEFFQIPYQNQ